MTGLLIFTLPIQQIVPALPKVLKAVASHTVNKLYIHFDEAIKRSSPDNFVPLSHKSHVIASIYSKTLCFCPNTDIHILLQGLKNTNLKLPNHCFNSINTVLIDVEDNTLSVDIKEKYKSVIKDKMPKFLITPNDINDISSDCLDKYLNEKVYNDVALGGTFDRMHAGHKILLSEAVLRTTKRLTVGVSDVTLLKNKTLRDLIEPCSVRMESVREFLVDIDNSLEYNIVDIQDHLGQTAWDSRMEMTVVSEEKGSPVDLINAHRKETGLNPLDSYCIPLYEDCSRISFEEESKISSSSQRMRLLGTRYHQPSVNKNIPVTPYVIGLTGGSASGKTQLADKVLKMGASIINCDKLEHKAYEKNTECYKKLLDQFGDEILMNDDEINRKALGSIVFANPEKLKTLNDIVWPEIAKLAEEEIEKCRQTAIKVVILDAAILLEAGWQSLCHEVWVSIVNEKVAVKRIMDRDRKNEEEARNRLQRQMSNEERLSYANIVFSTEWSHEYTQSQVNKAWSVLLAEKRLFLSSNV